MEEGKGMCVHGIPVYVSATREGGNTKAVFYFEVMARAALELSNPHLTYHLKLVPAISKVRMSGVILVLINRKLWQDVQSIHTYINKQT